MRRRTSPESKRTMVLPSLMTSRTVPSPREGWRTRSPLANCDEANSKKSSAAGAVNEKAWRALALAAAAAGPSALALAVGLAALALALVPVAGFGGARRRRRQCSG